MYNHTPDPTRARPADSWVEIPSRPSNSSLSSAAEDAGQHQSLNQRRSRDQNRPMYLPLNLNNVHNTGHNGGGGGSSSQEEYEESESESDRVMTSSNEALNHRSASEGLAEDDDNDEEDYDDYDDQDDIATAVGRDTTQHCFTPQPNAFTHPPSSTSRNRSSAPDSYFPPARPVPTSQRHSYPGNQRRDPRSAHSPYNAISPNHQAHHDAALRASLTTLLSCAAAARGLSKKQDSATHPTTGRPAGRVDTTTLRMVPESVALRAPGEPDSQNPQHRLASSPGSTSASPSGGDSSPSPPASKQNNQQHQAQAQAVDKSKRKAVGGTNAARSSSKDRRAAKKPRRLVSPAGPTNINEVSPTLTTWVVSAGVLVLVSAISFSAGYATGRESGRLEAGGVGAVRDLGDATHSCAPEVGTGMGKGLKRLRWGSATASVRA